MKISNFDPSWETNIYSKNGMINRYPFGELVSVFFRSLRFLNNWSEKRSETRVLEIGSGAGNNLWFFSKEGFDVYGIDGSESACRIARQQLAERECEANIQTAEFDNLPFEDEMFDIIVDREATYCGDFDAMGRTWAEANRVLRPGGLVIAFLFSDDHPDCIEARSDSSYATRIGKDTFTDSKSATFTGTGIAHFCSRKEIDDLFSFLDIKSISKHTNQTIFSSDENHARYAEWIVVGVKK